MKPFGQNYDIKQKYGVIRENNDGSTLELRKVSWYNKEPKLDIRNWNGDSLAKADSKLLLTESDAKALYNILHTMFGESEQTTSIPQNIQSNNSEGNPILSKVITIWD